jgi:NTE family protein
MPPKTILGRLKISPMSTRAATPADPAFSSQARRKPAIRRHINLALQGGGAHGAFTWGVLAQLIADRRIFIDGISGASAGAMNAVVFTDGFLKGGRQGAIDALEKFWWQISLRGFMNHADWRSWFGLKPDWRVDRVAGFVMFDMISRMLAPSQLNPIGLNPLMDLMNEQVDFAAIRADRRIKLFVTASNVRTCKPRVFTVDEITANVLMASACLPLLFPAVEIDGEAYWDGGYLGNPAIYPLIHECESNDVVIVQINPMNRAEIPVTARDILNRINEMSFNASLVREMRGIATVNQLIEDGRLIRSENYAPVLFHGIGAEADMSKLGSLSKFNTQWGFLTWLRDLGAATAKRWLDENFESLGERSTLDVFETYL